MIEMILSFLAGLAIGAAAMKLYCNRKTGGVATPKSGGGPGGGDE